VQYALAVTWTATSCRTTLWMCLLTPERISDRMALELDTRLLSIARTAVGGNLLRILTFEIVSWRTATLLSRSCRCWLQSSYISNRSFVGIRSKAPSGIGSAILALSLGRGTHMSCKREKECWGQVQWLQDHIPASASKD